MAFKANLENVAESGGARFAPEQICLLRVEEALEKKSRSGSDMVSMKLVVASGPNKGVFMYHNATYKEEGEKGAGIFKHFLKVIGVPYEGNVVVDATKWNGKVFKGRIEVVESNKNDNNGNPFLNNSLTLDSWAKDDENSPELGLTASVPKTAVAPVENELVDDQAVPF